MSSIQSSFANMIARLVKDSFFIRKAETATQRRSLERISNFTKFPRFVKSQQTELAGLSAIKFIPKKINKNRVVLYLHGGAYVAGSVRTHRSLIARIARASKCEAIGIDYRLAPEFPYPAALEDSFKAYKALIDSGNENIFLAGDSAGGGLSLALMLKLKAENVKLPMGAALISPWTDLAMTGESVRTKEHVDPLINPKVLGLFAAKYIGSDNEKNPFISPLYANLDGLPPTFIQVGGNEVLVDDSTRLAKKLKKAGCNVELEIWDKMFHVWHFLGGIIPESQSAIRGIGDFIINTHKSASENISNETQRIDDNTSISHLEVA